jgi:hypothetical protein
MSKRKRTTEHGGHRDSAFDDARGETVGTRVATTIATRSMERGVNDWSRRERGLRERNHPLERTTARDG